MFGPSYFGASFFGPTYFGPGDLIQEDKGGPSDGDPRRDIMARDDQDILEILTMLANSDVI